MPFKLFNPCEPCCQPCATIGWEFTTDVDQVSVCCSYATPPYKIYPKVENLPANIERIDECHAIVGGLRNCFFSGQFSEAQWPTVRNWVEDGGTLIIMGDFYLTACITATELAQLNNYLAAMGTGMSFGELVCLDEMNSVLPWRGNPVILNTDLKLCNEIENIGHYFTNEVIGGTWIASTYAREDPEDECSETVFIAGEQVGDGVVVAIADFNTFSFGSFTYPLNNCEFWGKLFEAARRGDVLATVDEEDE